MKNYILAVLMLVLACSPSLSAQTISIEQSKVNYLSAKQEIESMLSGKQPLSYEKAIFLVENAWWDNDMSFAAFQNIISRDTAIIRSVINQSKPKIENKESNNFFDALHEYNNAEKGYLPKALANTAIFSYLTDTLYFVDSESVLRHLPFSYSKSDPLGSNDWSNTQVLHLLGKGEGNCFALVSLFKIFSERFHSDASICTAPGHVYISHKDDKGIRYNVEIGSKVFPGIGTLSTLTHTTHDAIVNDISLRELSVKQSVALSLVYLAKGYEHKFAPVATDAFTMSCADLTLKYDSLNLNAMLLKAELWEKQIISKNKPVSQLQTDKTFISYQKLISHLCSLGYREMPLDMKNWLIKGWMKDTISRLADKSYQPTSKNTGMNATRYASLSWGLFEEQITTKPTERFGQTLFSTKAKKITSFVKQQNIYNDYDFDPVVFAWNVDPMAHKYPHASPYNFVENNPISRIDPDGADWILATGNKIYWYGGQYGDKKNLLTTFKATSGMNNAIKTTALPGGGTKKEVVNTQFAKYQKVGSVGPTPEGKYKISLKPDPERVAEADTRTGELKRNPQGGIEKIPASVDNPNKPGYMWTYEAWGENRARLEPVNVTGATSADRDLSSFYFHDSQKGYSHGCTECETGLFDKLKAYREAGNPSIEVQVQYPSPEHSTNGGTKKTTGN